MSKENLTQEYLKSILHYDPDTGVFTWKVQTGPRAKIGSIAGRKDKRYHCNIKINNTMYKAHRLAWLYVYGYMPENDLDHINRNPFDNRIVNLREISRSCNIRNSGNRKDNTSGVKGVYFDTGKNKWASYIRVNKKAKSLGVYKDFDNAVCARLAGEQCLSLSDCYNSSPALVYVKKHIQKNIL